MQHRLNLTQISDKVYAPIEWLNTLIPHEQRLLTNPYKEYPYLYFPSDYDTKPLFDFVKTQKGDADKIGIISTQEGLVLPKVEKEIRNTYNLLPDTNFLEQYNALFLAHKKKIETFFNVSIVASGDPQILIYTPGCFYIRHSDNCTELMHEGELVAFKPVASHRVVTTVLFLNDCVEQNPQTDQYTGGELSFDFFSDGEGKVVTLLPQKGYMLSFFSNPYYSHSVHVVKEGMRVSVAQWHSAIAH
jgi:predicted 2-oxoglutarate/Fe(II)-dependent dioxygenase YbiX